MPRLVSIALAVFAALGLLFLGAVVAVSGFRAGGDASGKAKQPPPAPPRDVSVTFAFQGGPNLVFLCWSHEGADVNFYDVRVSSFNGGSPIEEVRYGVTLSTCGPAIGTGEYMWKADLFHFAVRACNNAGCSAWTDASGPDAYWHSIPCSDPSGSRCKRPL